MWKKLLIGLVVVIIVLIIVFMMSVDQVAKAGIEKIGSRVLGTGVSVGSVHISPWSGEGTVKDLKIDNLKGYQGKYIFKIKQISIGVDLGSLFSDTVIIHHVDIEKPQVVYETGLGGSNINALQRNIQKSASEKQAHETKPGKQVVIESLVINDAKVTGSIGLVGTTASLPKIELKNIGRGGGMSYAQATGIVFGALVKSLATINLQDIGKPLGKAGEVIKTVGQEVGKGVGAVGRGAGEAVKSVGKAVQGILGN